MSSFSISVHKTAGLGLVTSQPPPSLKPPTKKKAPVHICLTFGRLCLQMSSNSVREKGETFRPFFKKKMYTCAFCSEIWQASAFQMSPLELPILSQAVKKETKLSLVTSPIVVKYKRERKLWVFELGNL